MSYCMLAKETPASRKSANANDGRVIIWDSHPVQYKAPVYRELELAWPGTFKVLYGSDRSLRGYRDPDFAHFVAWDSDLLGGYECEVLNLERKSRSAGFRSLSGGRVYNALKTEAPSAILISQFLYESDFAALFVARRLGVPVFIRQETQDEAFVRSQLKDRIRSALYRLIYKLIRGAFYIGELNRQHLLRHGFRESQLARSPYCVSDPIRSLTEEQKARLRAERRGELGFEGHHCVVLFSGKLIEKKNPALILNSLIHARPDLRRRAKVVYMGSGELENPLRDLARQYQVDCRFLGFLNQSRLAANYLAADILVLPSKRMGETWGLVVNEALQAGCGVVMTDAVGCYREFGSWERARVIREDDAIGCANALEELSSFPRSFHWCEQQMTRYSTHEAAHGIGLAFEDDRWRR